jgi:pimeloyl-ACP methyl ester carboxylesterase
MARACGLSESAATAVDYLDRDRVFAGMPGGSRRLRLGWLLAAASAAASLALAGPAAARESNVAVKTPDGPGPAELDRVFVHQFGPASGDKVLVLMPGTQGGAGDFTLTARYLVNHIDGLQVWAIDRRTQALEDTAVFRRALEGKVSLQQMFDHYLGWIANGGTPADHFQFLDTSQYPFARRWGMGVALRDAHAVVQRAAAGGRRVVLGGHSLGASLTLAYAAWDFKGRAGYRDLDGMLLIDGGLLGSFDAYNLTQAQQAISDLREGNPFAQLLGPGLPAETAGLFGEVAGLYARLAPSEPATTLQDFPLLPPELNPPFTVTDRALLGYAFDRDTSPLDASLRINGGRLATSGDPRDWVNGGVTPVHRLAATFGQEPSNSIEWYFPRRLTIDTNGADQLRNNDVARYLGLRLFHTRQVDLPLYALQTDLTGGHVLRGALRFIDRSRTTRSESRLVNADPEQSHLDPLMAAVPKNRFFSTVVPFLRYRAFGKSP